MGFLKDIFSGGSGALAGASQAFGTAGLIANTVGAYNSGAGQSQLLGYQAAVAQNNSAIALANAQTAAAAGSMAESEQKLKTGVFASQQLAAQGANGLDVNIGSPKAVRDTTATIGAIDAGLMHFNAARQVLGLEQEAQNYSSQAELDKAASKNALALGVAKAGSTFLTGATSLASKWSQFQQSGAVPQGAY